MSVFKKTTFAVSMVLSLFLFTAKAQALTAPDQARGVIKATLGYQLSSDNFVYIWFQQPDGTKLFSKPIVQGPFDTDSTSTSQDFLIDTTYFPDGQCLLGIDVYGFSVPGDLDTVKIFATETKNITLNNAPVITLPQASVVRGVLQNIRYDFPSTKGFGIVNYFLDGSESAFQSFPVGLNPAPDHDVVYVGALDTTSWADGAHTFQTVAQMASSPEGFDMRPLSSTQTISFTTDNLPRVSINYPTGIVNKGQVSASVNYDFPSTGYNQPAVLELDYKTPNGTYAQAASTPLQLTSQGTNGTWNFTFDSSNWPDGNYTLIAKASYYSSNSAQTNIQLVKTVDRTAQPPLSMQKTTSDPVNIATGEMYLSATDIKIPASGLPLSLSRFYRSQSQNQGAFGYGWYCLYDTKLDISRADGIIIYYDQQGVASYYIPQSDGTYKSSEGNHSQLVKTVGGNYTLTDKYGIVTAFDVNGKFESIVDRNNNHLYTNRDSNGNPVSASDTFGRQIVFTIDPTGKIVKAQDPAGKIIQYAYDANNNLTTITDPAGSITTYVYDSSHHVIQVTNANGHSTYYTYDNNGRCVQYYQDGNINQTSLQFLTAGQTVVTDALNNQTTYQFNNYGLVTQVTDALGNIQSTVWDKDLNRTSVTDKNGNTTTFTYDSLGNLLTVTEPSTSQSSPQPSLMMMAASTGIPSDTTTFTYSSDFNLITSITDKNGNLTSYDYDANGNLIRTTDTLGNTVNINYDSNGNPLITTDANGNTTTYTYDANEYPLTITDALGHKTQVSYDVRGNLVNTIDPKGSKTTFAYDVLNRLIKTAYSDLTSTAIAYDTFGNKIKFTDQKGNITSYAYDTAERLIKTTDALGGTVVNAYDNNSDLLTLTDQNNNATTYTYDALGRMVTKTNPLNQVASYIYDPNGNMLTSTDANGATTNYAYDALNRLTGTTYPDSTQLYRTYDPMGRLLTLSNQTTNPGPGPIMMMAMRSAGASSSTSNAPITITYNYDSLGHVLSVSGPLTGESISYTYDANGNRISMTDSDNVTTAYAYDALNRLIQINDSRAGVTNYTYDENSNVITIALPNTATTSYTYDSMNRPLTMTNTSLGVSDIKSYSYDPSGLIIRILETTGVHTDYAYDALSRLISEKILQPQGPNAKGKPQPDKVLFQRQYIYDPAGNRISMANGTTIFASTYDVANQLQSVQKTVIQSKLPVVTQVENYTYDNNGNRLSKTVTGASITTPQVTQYSYDFLNQLTQVVNPKNQTINYAYDYTGRRINRAIGTSNLSYIYDGSNVLADCNAKGRILRRYTRNPLSGGGVNGLLAIETRIPIVKTTTPPVSIDDPEDEAPDVEEPTDVDPLTLGAFYYYQYDHLGSVTGLTDSTGLLSTQYGYTAFGLTRTSQGLAQGNLYKYSSKAYDGATGLYYYGRRYYDPAVGRWLTQDPMGMIDGTNRYAFVRNNSVNMIDPWGLCTENMSLLNPPNILVAGINQYVDSQLLAQASALGVDEKYVYAPYGGEGYLAAAGQLVGITAPYPDFQNLAGQTIGTAYCFSGGEAAFKRAASYYNITYSQIAASESPGSGEVNRYGMTHGGPLQYIIPAIPVINEKTGAFESKITIHF